MFYRIKPVAKLTAVLFNVIMHSDSAQGIMLDHFNPCCKRHSALCQIFIGRLKNERTSH